MRTELEYKKAGIFLIAYLFFSTGGVVFTIYSTNFFINCYPMFWGGKQMPTSEVALVQLFYLSSLVVGVVAGLLYSKFVKMNDIAVLTVQNFLFFAAFAALFVDCTLNWSWDFLLWSALAVGFLYSWNASCARGVIAKLAPQERRCEMMGLYSTCTYLGITVVSTINMVLSALQVRPEWLCVILVAFMAPSFAFLVALARLGGTHPPAKIASKA